MQFILTVLICVSERKRERDRRRERENRAYLVFYKINRLSWCNASFGASHLLACTFDLFLSSTCMQLQCGCFDETVCVIAYISKNKCNRKYAYYQSRDSDDSDSNNNLQWL